MKLVFAALMLLALPASAQTEKPVWQPLSKATGWSTLEAEHGYPWIAHINKLGPEAVKALQDKASCPITFVNYFETKSIPGKSAVFYGECKDGQRYTVTEQQILDTTRKGQREWAEHLKDGIEGIFLIMIVAGLYFAPVIVASSRRHRNTTPIFLLDLIFGWTGIGWIAALIWSFTANTRTA